MVEFSGTRTTAGAARHAEGICVVLTDPVAEETVEILTQLRRPQGQRCQG
jgi:hypothetical protein